MNRTFKTLVCAAMLVALDIILSRFCSISTPLLKIGLAFVPIAVCGMLFGPLWAGAVGGLADFLGAVLFPIGPYFPGITLSAALTGVVFGLFLHRRGNLWLRAAGAAAVNCLVISLFLTSFWLHILSGTPYWATVAVRVPQACLLAPIQFLVIRLLQKPMSSFAAYSGLRPAA